MRRCTGRSCCCCRERDASELSELVGRIEHVELEQEPDFFELFVDGCQFTPIPAA